MSSCIPRMRKPQSTQDLAWEAAKEFPESKENLYQIKYRYVKGTLK